MRLLRYAGCPLSTRCGHSGGKSVRISPPQSGQAENDPLRTFRRTLVYRAMGKLTPPAFCLALCSLLALGCAPTPPKDAPLGASGNSNGSIASGSNANMTWSGPSKLSAEERRSCDADHGVVRNWSLGNERCFRPMGDGGNSCADGSQCQSGYCVVDESVAGFRGLDENSEATGICTSDDGYPSCAISVKNGRATHLACI